MPVLQTVLFDMGGVLTLDPWETLLLTPQYGIADRLGLDRTLVRKTGEALWRKYATSPTEEQMYWEEYGRAVGHKIEIDLVHEIESSTLRTNIAVGEVLSLLEAAGVEWGIVSDNTSFWYPKQLKSLALDGQVTTGLEFLSYRYGTTKRRTPSLFDIAAKSVDPSSTLIIDDRVHNVRRAIDLGFSAMNYSMYMECDTSLQEKLSRHYIHQGR